MLYKYCKTDGFDILLQSRLRGARIEEFNDPFEFAFALDRDTALGNIKREFKENAGLMEMWKELLDNQGVQFDKSSPEDIMNKVTNFQINDFGNAVKTAIESLSKKVALICLSEQPDIIQMWAHYADNHSGIVVGIEKSEFDKDKKGFDPVDYRDDVVLFPVIADPKKIEQYKKYFLGVINRKETQWGYEKEVRVCTDLDEKDIYHTIPASSIKEIYLGLRSHETTEIIAKSIKQRDEYKHLRIYKMYKHESAYKLISKEL